MQKKDWRKQKVVIVGAARQGIALARYLDRHGATVVLNDRRTDEELIREKENLSETKVEWILGDHPVDILDGTNTVYISGGVPMTNPMVEAAKKKGITISNDTQVFMETVPCKTLGITGSAGKTTTTTLVGRIAQAGAEGKFRKIWVGGNIGDPLINHVDEMQPSDLAILEISSFQSELMTVSPDMAAILNITPNHLDRHGTMENYIEAKANVINFQSEDDIAILGRDTPSCWELASRVHGRLVSFGFSTLPDGQNGSYIEDEQFFLRDGEETVRLPVESNIELRGDHNRSNVLAACTVAYTAGFSIDAMQTGIKDFRGVPHRLEYVCNWRGAQWYNDSIATAPERTMAAIRSFSEPIVLMLGGRDKNLPWEDLAELVHQRVDHVVIFGEASGKIEAALGNAVRGQRPYSQVRVPGLREAVQAAAQVVQPGYVVLFSPGGTSFDAFKDFEERGERFKQWVLELSKIR